jgi:hypothetical protein
MMSIFQPEQPLQYSIEPHKTTAQLIVEQEGEGVIGPSSADPLPSDIWERVDLAAVEEDLKRLAAHEASVSIEDRRKYTESSGFYFSPEERAFLAKLGETSLSI